MGQKTNPIGNRLGIIRGWESNWYGNKKDFANKLIEDHKIRTYLNARINKGGISKIVIERTLGKLIITIHTSKPGIIIGKGGGEVDRIKEELKKLNSRKLSRSTGIPIWTDDSLSCTVPRYSARQFASTWWMWTATRTLANAEPELASVLTKRFLGEVSG